VTDVPVDGFWPISLCNAQGYFEKNASNAYSLNNFTAKKNPDASVTIQFGACDGNIANCLPTPPGGNYGSTGRVRKSLSASGNSPRRKR